MIEFATVSDLLVLIYHPQHPWVERELETASEIPLKKRTFLFSDTDVLGFGSDDISEEIAYFALGRLDGEYLHIEGRILGISQDVFIRQGLAITEAFFITIRGFSVFRQVAAIVTEDIYIGGAYPSAIPEADFKELLKAFPNNYELQKYVAARLAVVLGNYFDSASDVQASYQRYMNARRSVEGTNLTTAFRESELDKYAAILRKVELMLEEEGSYTEKQWQLEILEIILLLYPKYIRAFKEVRIRDTYSDKNRSLDFMLVDAGGAVDIIEIKKPFAEKILTKGRYRDNYIPMRELSGTVMQIEKYIFYLNKWGRKGEEKLTDTYRSQLPDGLTLKVTNPCGIIIMGRDAGLSPAQRADFEVVKRKYRNVVDIITYDDLIRRLRSIIEALQRGR